MALVDLVIQVEAPSSVPSGLQPIAEGWDEAAAAAVWPRTPSERWARLFSINR